MPGVYGLLTSQNSVPVSDPPSWKSGLERLVTTARVRSSSRFPLSPIALGKAALYTAHWGSADTRTQTNMAYLAPGQGSGSSSSSSANKENALFHSVIASSAAPAPYAAHANPLAQSHSQYYHRPLPPSPSKTTATAVPYHVRPQPPLQHHPSAAPPTRGLPPSASAPSLAAYADDPTIAQLLAAQGRPAGAGGSAFHYPHSHATNGGPRDLTMGNATGLVSWRKGQGFKEWEKVKLESAEVKRKADVAQLCQSMVDSHPLVSEWKSSDSFDLRLLRPLL